MNELRIGEDRSAGPVSAIWQRPAEAEAVYVFAHGAGADMRHHFMQRMADALASQNIATLRFNFPYMEHGKRAPNPQPMLEAYIRSACGAARELAPELSLFAGGKSMGGRMTSNAAAKAPIEGLQGIVFVGFPLHAPKRPGRDRAAHLAQVNLPMLFLQGTRDDLADIALIRDVTGELRAATLHVVEGANHSFDVPKRIGRSGDQIIQELAQVTANWMRRHGRAAQQTLPQPVR